MKKIQAASAAAVLGFLGLLYSQSIHPTGDTYSDAGEPADCSRIYAEWGVPVNAIVCLLSSVHGPSEAFSALCIADDGTGYARVRICPDGSPPCEGAECEPEIPDLPPGLTAIADSQRTIPYQAGWPTFAAWSPGNPEAPYDCACSTGQDCMVGDRPAMLGVTEHGAVGVGCRPKTCVELAGSSSWPDACPTPDEPKEEINE